MMVFQLQSLSNKRPMRLSVVNTVFNKARVKSFTFVNLNVLRTVDNRKFFKAQGDATFFHFNKNFPGMCFPILVLS